MNIPLRQEGSYCSFEIRSPVEVCNVRDDDGQLLRQMLIVLSVLTLVEVFSGFGWRRPATTEEVLCSVAEAVRVQENATRCTEKFSPIR